MAARLASLEEAVHLGNLEGIELEDLAAKFGTPCFIYSAGLIRQACRKAQEAVAALDARLYYAVKANGNLSVLKLIMQAGFGFDVASILELKRALHVGAKPEAIVLTGPGKSEALLKLALAEGIHEIICDSHQEYERLAKLVSAPTRTRVGVRINPAIDAGAHPHVATGLVGTKFGEPPDRALALYRKIVANPNLPHGSLSCHIGSQIAASEPYISSAKQLLELLHELGRDEIDVPCIDLGGGFAIGDATERPAADPLAELGRWLERNAGGASYSFQPGRAIVGRAAMLLTRAEYLKGNFLIVDAAMTELLRPALYGARHAVAHNGGEPAGTGAIEVVGPVCENADFIAKGVDLDAKPGDLVAVFDCGAYASVMSSGYNGRLLAAEVMVDKGYDRVIRARQSFEESIAAEEVLDFMS